MALVLTAFAACHHAAPSEGPSPVEGTFEFRAMEFKPPIRGTFTISEGVVYLTVPSARCERFTAARAMQVSSETSAFECSGFPGYPVVDVFVSLRNPVFASRWSAVNNTAPPPPRTECVQTGVNARGQRICLSTKTTQTGSATSAGGILRVERKVPPLGA